MNQKPRTKNGFTLVELVVIIGIIGFMSSLVILGQNQGQDQRKIILEVRRLVQDIRKAQNFTISSTTYDCGGLKVVPFGIILYKETPHRYILVADCDGSRTYDSSVDRTVSSYTFTVSEINTLSPPPNPMQIFFVSPNPDIYVNNSVITNTIITITVCGTKRSLSCRNVQLTSGGAVSVQ